MVQELRPALNGLTAMRVLLSEGSSTSAREAITALGLKGHTVEVCDPNPRCLGRFSRFVHRFHRCPGLADDPEGFLSFILDRITRSRYDVLLPIHEQGFLLARVRERIAPHTGIALPRFESYERALSKASFSRLLSELALPQPETELVAGRDALLRVDRFPVVLKASIGTASRGIWVVHDSAELEEAVAALEESGGCEEPVLVQALVEGVVEHAQAVFCAGRLVGFHAYAQVMRGAGGGDAVKESVRRPQVRAHMITLGERLAWHGALSVDYIMAPNAAQPLFIDCNPRLVEPMSAFIAGLDLVDLLLRVSRGESPPGEGDGRAGVRTHIAIQGLLGAALRDGRRMSILREGCRLLAKGGPYVGSREELTPLRWDWWSAVPVIVAAVWLLLEPKAAHVLPRTGWGAHLLNPAAVRKIRAMHNGKIGDTDT
jgi:predicted ATP-grasp superfamily ATP-dependent carboligase